MSLGLEDFVKGVAGPLYLPHEAAKSGDGRRDNLGTTTTSGLGCSIALDDYRRERRIAGGPATRDIQILFFTLGDEEWAKGLFDRTLAPSGTTVSTPKVGDAAAVKPTSETGCERGWEVDVRDTNLIIQATVKGTDYVNEPWIEDPAYRGKQSRKTDGYDDGADIACAAPTLSDKMKGSAIQLAALLAKDLESDTELRKH